MDRQYSGRYAFILTTDIGTMKKTGGQQFRWIRVMKAKHESCEDGKYEREKEKNAAFKANAIENVGPVYNPKIICNANIQKLKTYVNYA